MTKNRLIESQNDLINTLKDIVDRYKLGEIPTIELEEQIFLYVKENFDLLLDDEEDEGVFRVQSTPMKKLGKKRMRIIAHCLERRKLAKPLDFNEGIFRICKKVA